MSTRNYAKADKNIQKTRTPDTQKIQNYENKVNSLVIIG